MGGVGPQGTRLESDVRIGFVAGILSVALFHQLAVFVLGFVGLDDGEFYSFRPTAPFGVPRVMSQMFWGGIWGVLFALIIDRLPMRWPVVVSGLLFGWCGPVLFGWTVAPALRGAPLFGGWNPSHMLSHLLANGVFGIAAALIFTWLRRKAGGRAA
jgi:hypothetical protein